MRMSKMHAALIPAVALVALGALAAGVWIGWADALWVCWAGLFAVLEGNAIANESEGDTLSERLRAWFRTKTPAGRFGFTVIVVALCSWLIPHILIG